MLVAKAPKVHGVVLSDLLQKARFVGVDDLVVNSCASDSRACRSGDLYVALVGSEHDGHDFVDEAIHRGATAILAERLIPTAGVPVCQVRDTRAAFGKICQALAGQPSRQMKVVGVTGTNGKTTTSCLITSVLETAGMRTGVMGTLGYCDSVKTFPASLTTPGPVVLADCMTRMLGHRCSHAVLEISSHALAQQRTAGIELDAACVTNVRHDHLDFHGTLSNYRAVKGRIFDLLRPEGVAVLSADDPACSEYLQSLDHPALTIGMRNPAELTATVIERFASEQTFLLTAGNDTVPVRTRIIGDGHIYNCLTAAAIGLTYGVDLLTIVRGLERVDEMPGRLQRIECGQPFGVFVDYAHTPDALAGSLSTLRDVTRGRLICVFGAGGDRDRKKRPKMARAAEEAADLVIVTDDNPRSENPERIVRDILKGFRSRAAVDVVRDRTEAIQLVLSLAKPGDCVLIAGKGHEAYQLVGGVCHDHDDREVARGWLRRGTQVANDFGFTRRAA